MNNAKNIIKLLFIFLAGILVCGGFFTDTKITQAQNSPKIIQKLVNFGFEKSNGRKIDTIIIHSTYNPSGTDKFNLNKILSIYKSYGVSPHYIIDRTGNIYQLVSDKNIAYHAGKSKTPDGRTEVNNFSLGIEIINDKISKPTDQQYTALNSLSTYLKSKYSIKYVLGHNQVSPGRKDDPWNFDWGKVNSFTRK